MMCVKQKVESSISSSQELRNLKREKKTVNEESRMKDLNSFGVMDDMIPERIRKVKRNE
jgi:hypothetical protein